MGQKTGRPPEKSITSPFSLAKDFSKSFIASYYILVLEQKKALLLDQLGMGRLAVGLVNNNYEKHSLHEKHSTTYMSFLSSKHFIDCILRTEHKICYTSTSRDPTKVMI